MNVNVIRLKEGEGCDGASTSVEPVSIESVVVCKDRPSLNPSSLQEPHSSDIIESGNDFQDLDTSRDFIKMFKCVGLKTVLLDGQEIVLLRESNKLFAIDVVKREARCVQEGSESSGEQLQLSPTSPLSTASTSSIG